METKIYNEKKYKKTTSIDGAKRRSTSINQKLKGEPAALSKKKSTPKVDKYKIKLRLSKGVNITICFVLLIILSCITRSILKKPDEPFFNIFGTQKVIEKIDELVIAVVDDKFNYETNAVFCELELKTNQTLLAVCKDYTIKYGLIKSINKISNKEYELIFEDENIAKRAEIVIESNLEVENIVSMENNVKITLKEDDPYFIYKLQLAVPSENFEKKILSNHVNYVEKNNNQFSVKKIDLLFLSSMKEEVEKYKQGEIDMFLTNNANALGLLGKYEYNMYRYNLGKALFILGNPKSSTYARKEVRQAINYAIDREKIIKDVYLNGASSVESPYIYENSWNAYDIYAAKNILLTNGYKLNGGVYAKENTKLSLDLIVNSDSNEKKATSVIFKQNMAEIGIDINIIVLSKEDVEKRIESGNYDLILADIYLNEVPDLRYIMQFANEEIKKEMDNIYSATNIDETVRCVQQYIKTCKQEAVYIGICSQDTFVITNKELALSNVGYLHIFDELCLTE